MLRIFETHYERKYHLLEGMWDFKVPENDKIYKMSVPSCWEMHPDFYTYRGKGTYTKEIYLNSDCNLRLVFKGVSHTADVYFDDEFVTHHYNAYTPFDGIIKNVKSGLHTIRVEVDNSFSEASALHIPNDYYTYGGIIRSCAYEILGDCYIKNVHFTPVFDNGKWYGKFVASLVNLSEKAITADFNINICGKDIVFKCVSISAESEIEIEAEEEFENVIPWSNENPKLYYITSKLYINDALVDDLIDRTGFRTSEVKGKNILVNGEKVYLKGFNRHEDHGSAGCAIPTQLMMKDIEIMLDLGCNAVRFSHYPNDELFIDMCDEKGLMVWEENHARGLYLPDMLNPNFEKQCEDCIDEMIENHFNHPSIIIWGILNECSSETTEGREMYRKQYDQIKQSDTSRPTTSATCRYFTDISLDLPDIASLNIYSEWYFSDKPYQKDFKETIDWMRNSGAEDKPIIMSEFGGAAIYGFREPQKRKWSEERQAEIIDNCLELYMNSEETAGVFIWQFADCQVTEEGDWYKTRVRCHNNKGVYDEYRRPKLAAEIVRKHFKK
jgi:beta-glucuronidase